MSEGVDGQWTLAKKVNPAAKWIAFISYTRKDDEAYDGIVTKLHTSLQRQLRGCGGNVYLDRNSSRDSVNFKKGVSSVLEDRPVFIPILSPAWFESPECDWEYSQFAVLTNQEEYDRDHYPLPKLGEGEVIPVSFGDMNEIRKSFSRHKASELFMAPALLDLEEAWVRDEIFRQIVDALRKKIQKYWSGREWRLDQNATVSTIAGDTQTPMPAVLESRGQGPIGSDDLSSHGTFLALIRQRCLALNLSTANLPEWLNDVAPPPDGWDHTDSQNLLIDMVVTWLAEDGAITKQWLNGVLHEMGAVTPNRSAKVATQGAK